MSYLATFLNAHLLTLLKSETQVLGEVKRIVSSNSSNGTTLLLSFAQGGGLSEGRWMILNAGVLGGVAVVPSVVVVDCRSATS